MRDSNHHSHLLRLLAAVVVVLLGVSWTTLAGADMTVPDGDGAVPVGTSTLDFGNVCVGETYNDTVLVAIRRANGLDAARTFGNSTTVTVSAVEPVAAAPDTTNSVTEAMAAGDATITTPSDWLTQPDGTMTHNTASADPTATVNVTLVPTAAGAYGMAFSTRSTGTNYLGALIPITVATNQRVIWNASVCNSPPVLTVPDDIVVDPSSATGASVSWVTSATDAEDDPDPTPVCKSGTWATGSVITSPHDFGFGVTTVTCRATDTGGLHDEESFTVTVNDFGFEGFYSPVNNEALNTIKGGQTVPLKFDVTGANGEFSDTAVVLTLKQTEFKCPDANDDVIEDPVDATVTGATSLRWDATGQQFVFNWKSPSTKNKCYRVTVTTSDGEPHSLLFKTK